MFADEARLLLRRKDHHGVFVVGIAERREYFSTNPEIGMVHVCVFANTGQTEGETTKLGWCHGTVVMITMLWSRYDVRSINLHPSDA